MSELKLASFGQYYREDDTSRRYSITDEESAFIQALSWQRKCLDVGTGVGVSALAMNVTAKSVTTVDPDEWVINNIELPPEIRRLEAIPDGIPSEKFQFALIDGDHSYESAYFDWNVVRRQMAPRSIVAFHDNNQGHPGVVQLIKEIRELKYKVFELPTLGRLTLVLVP